MVELITEQEAKIPLLQSTPLCSKVSSEKVVEDVGLNTRVFDLTLSVVGRTYFSDCLIISGVDILTGLLTENEVVVFTPIDLRAILDIGITEHTVGMLEELVIVCKPIWVIKRSATEADLTGRIIGGVVGHSFEIELNRCGIDHVYNTIVGTRCRFNSHSTVVGREPRLPLIVNLPVHSTTSTSTCHACRRNDTGLISITDTERIVKAILVLADAKRRVLCETRAEEVIHIVMDFRRHPTIKTCCLIFGVVELSLVGSQVAIGVFVIGVTAVCSIVRQVGNLRTPAHGCCRIVSTDAVALCIDILMFELTAQGRST